MANPSVPSALTQAIGTSVRRHAAASARIDQRSADQAGLTLSTCEANFVNLLQLRGAMSPGRLGQLTELTSSGTVTGVIDRLERAGYVQRARCIEDRRKVEISLNDDMFRDVDTQRSQRLAGILAGYDEAQRATIAEFLTRLADAEAEVAVAPAG